MNVLVTGGTGYIGSHTCVELIEAGHTPIVIDNLSNSNPESLHRVAEITGKPVEFIEGDVRDEALLEKIFAEHEISCAIHFAGLKAVGESVAKPMDYYQNNLDATLTLCKVMAKHNVKRIIFSSSATVYSGDNSMPLRETSHTGMCTNPYGWTKVMIEQIQSAVERAKRLGDYKAFRESYNQDRLHCVISDSRETVPAAFALFCLADGDPVKAIEYGANFGRDTDTIGSMVGALCGAFKGIEGLKPEWVKQIEERGDEQLKLAEGLVELIRTRHAEAAKVAAYYA